MAVSSAVPSLFGLQLSEEDALLGQLERPRRCRGVVAEEMTIFLFEINDLPMAGNLRTLGRAAPTRQSPSLGKCGAFWRSPHEMIQACITERPPVPRSVSETDEKPPRESRRAMQRRLKRPPGRPRNPHLEQRFAPTQEQRDLVRLLAGYGIPPERICKVIRNPATRRPIGEETLRKRFEDELETGAAEMDAVCVGMLSTKIRQGNIVAIIWYMKNRMGWRDVTEQQGRNAVDLSIAIKPEELADKLREHGLPPIVFGYDKPAIDLEPPRIEHTED